jgi:hypothetical protein
LSFEKVNALSKLLLEMDDVLDRIIQLHVSVPGPSDPEWLDAISTLETGFSKAVSFVAKVKGIKIREFMLFPDVVDRVLKAEREAS